MAGRPLQIAIAGAGIAGLSSAILLARGGHKVTLFDQFDAPRPIGSGLLMQPTGMAVLDHLGLGDAVRNAGTPVTRLHGIAGRRTVLDVDYGTLAPGAHAIGVHRSSLFDILWTAARASGAETEWPRRVVGVDDGRIRFENGSNAGRFDLVIDASGARSNLAAHEHKPLPYGALWATVDRRDDMPAADCLSQRYRKARQMAGLLPVGSATGHPGKVAALFWSVRGDQVNALRERGFDAFVEDWARLWPETMKVAQSVGSFEAMTFARYVHHTLKSPIANRLVHLGDSWHATSPQLGQGANMALLDAFALARAIERSDDIAGALGNFVEMRRAHVRLYQLLSYWLTPVYQSDGWFVPLMRDWLVGPVSSVNTIQKMQAALVSGLAGGPMKRLDLNPRLAL